MVFFQMAGDAVAQSSNPFGPRPVLKGHHHAFMKRHLFIGIALSLVGIVVAKYTINEPRKKAYAEFYK